MNRQYVALWGCVALCLCDPALAVHTASPTHAPRGNGTTFLSFLFAIIAGIAGTSLFFSSLVRSKNTLATAGQVVIAACAAAIVAALVATMHGITELTIPVDIKFLLAAGSPTLNESVALATALSIQVAGLIFGSSVERLRLSAVVMISAAWAGLVLLPLVYWIWRPTGLMAIEGVMDWAGALMHVATGAGALALAIVTGNRHSYGRVPMPPYHLGLAVFGALIMLVGWIGFNESGAVVRESPGSGAVNTMVAAAGGLFMWSVIESINRGITSTLGMVSGALSGAIACSAAAGWISPFAAVLFGFFGGGAGYFGAVTLRRFHTRDDSLDIFGIHAIPATIGLVMTGLIVGATPAVAMIQFAAAIAVGLYAFFIVLLIASLLKWLGRLRVNYDEEDAGLDIVSHGETVHPPQSTL